ncbi:MAG: glycosyltransferase [Bacteroidales bacterium]|nr:glycosyltransferase [Bacteroidales bacterium]
MKQNNTLISILIPAYNASSSIEYCVRSITSNYKEDDIEIIILNDGSTDNTLSIIKTISEDDSRVKVYTQDNTGASIARAKLLTLANGSYIWFVDADDYLIEQALYIVRDQIQKDDTWDVLAFPYYLRKGEKIKLDNHYAKNLLRASARDITGVEFLRIKNGYNYFCTQVYKLKTLITNRVSFITPIRFMEDTYVSARLYLIRGLRVHIISEPLYIYDIGNMASITHSATISQERIRERLSDISICVSYLENVYLENREDEEKKKSLLFMRNWVAANSFSFQAKMLTYSEIETILAHYREIGIYPFKIYPTYKIKWRIFLFLLNIPLARKLTIETLKVLSK